MLEENTRTSIINKKLIKFWRDINNHNQVIEEFSIQKNNIKLYADYALLDTDWTVIAIVEAKKFSRNPRDWQFQAIEYAQLIEEKQWYCPFIFLSNWIQIQFLNLNIPSNPRIVKTFFSLQDLKRIRELNKIQTLASDQKVNNLVAWRTYQIEAIKRICEWVDYWKREFLLVMATWTWKTRTAMALIDNLFKSHHVQKVLFLCDRTALRDQSFDDGFKVFFESTPKTKIETWKTDDNARLYSATYQTMINYLDNYSSGYFDLIIVDEVHRSIYWEWQEILNYFDAIKVWLTATPVEFVDRNTYHVFWCREQDPTFYYWLDEAINDWYLVPYNVLMARTKFQIQWIKWRQLPDEIRNQLIKEWKDPESYNFEWDEIGKKIDNKDTNRALVKEFMEQSLKIEDWLPWKTIIFAMNQKHAEHLQEAFEEMYPHLVNFSVVITSNVEMHDELLKDFKKLKTEKKFRVAISVDMLDTGIDVPEVITLVFAKKVFSEAKFWQMVGRWTRLCKDIFGPWEDKENFLILDFALNFDEEHKFKPLPAKQISLQQKLFEELIEHLRLFENRSDKKNYEKTKNQIVDMLKSLPVNDEILTNNDLIDSIKSWKIWDNIAINPKEALQKIAPLMRYYDKFLVEELKFLVKVEKFANQYLKWEDLENLTNSIANDINSLSQNIWAVKEKQSNINKVLSREFWQQIKLEDLEEIKTNFTGLMKYKNPNIPQIILTDIKDEVVERRWIQYGEWKQIETDKYWKLFVESIDQYAKSSIAIQKIVNDEQVNDRDLIELETLFKNMEYHFTAWNLNKVFHSLTTDFVDLVKVALWKWNIEGWEGQVNWLFERFIGDNNFNANQIRFLQIVKALILQKKFVKFPDDFYLPVFENQFGIGAFDRLFRQEDVEKVEEFVERFRI